MLAPLMLPAYSIMAGQTCSITVSDFQGSVASCDVYDRDPLDDCCVHCCFAFDKTAVLLTSKRQTAGSHRCMLSWAAEGHVRNVLATHRY